MKTLADFKKRLAVGQRVRVTSLRTDHRGQIPPATERTVSVVQTKQFATKLDDGREIWCPYGKASDFRVDGPDDVTLLDSDMGGDGEPYVSFTFLPAEPST